TIARCLMLSSILRVSSRPVSGRRLTEDATIMSKRTHIRAATLLGVSLAALGVSAPAMADTQPANESGQSENTIIVTARVREQNLQDTPLAITAVNAAMLEARSQTNISEITNQAPSVTLKAQGTAYGASMSASIRGVGQYDFNPALEPGVG